MSVDTTGVGGCVFDEVVHDAAGGGDVVEVGAIPRMACVVVFGVHILCFLNYTTKLRRDGRDYPRFFPNGKK